MRTDATANYVAANSEDVRELRMVISLNFGTPGAPDLVYFTSHSDILIAGATVYPGVIEDASSITQKINPLEGRSEIGAVSFELVDQDETITTLIQNKQNAGFGLRGKDVKVFSGFRNLAWADYRLEQTQQIAKAYSYDAGKYKFQCQDRQREQRKDIFVLAKTRLSGAVGLIAKDGNGEAITASISVYDTSGFKPNWHGPSYSLQSFTMPVGSLVAPRGLYIFKIRYQNGWEICAATEKTATTFTGVYRGLFGTKIAAHSIDGSASPDNGPEVEEVAYLELPVLKAIYAILTGKLIGQPHTLDASSGTYKDELPPGWQLGIDPAYVDLDAFVSTPGVGREDLTDLYLSTDDTGFVVRFDNNVKTDGKQFVEKELCLLAGVTQLIRATGQIGLKRMAGVVSSASYVDALDETNVLDAGGLTHDLDGLVNSFAINWAWLELPEAKQFYRVHKLTDTASIEIHGTAKLTELSFKGLHAGRHTENTIRSAFNALRDRHSGPPEKITLKLLPSKNAIEVGDIVRVKLANVRTPNGTLRRLDRSMEVQNISVNLKTQSTTVQLFGSSRKASPISYISTAVLPDGWYPAGATAWPQATSGGISTATANVSAGTYYFAGDLTINHNVTINGSVFLRVRGTLTINALIDGKGRSGATGAAYFGDAESTGEVYWYLSHGSRKVISTRSVLTKGQTSKVPALNIGNDAGVLTGVPVALNGTKGTTGGAGKHKVTGNALNTVSGGLAGNAGAGFGVVARGLVFGAGGYIDTSGNDGSPGQMGSAVVWSGSGAGGCPGAILVMFDGKPGVIPIFEGRIIANRGACVLQGVRPTAAVIKYQSSGKPAWRSYYEGMQAEDMAGAAFEWGYVPESKNPYPDYSLIDPTSGALVFQQNTMPVNADALAVGKRNLATGDLWYDTTDGQRAYRHNGSAWIIAAPTSLYAVDARSAAIVETRTDGVLFSETFSDPNSIAQWEAYAGNDSGELSIGTDSEMTTGGKCLFIGNNTDNDEVWRTHQALIPIQNGVLYRIRARVRRTAGSGTFYLGVEGIAADGVTRVNITGAASRSSQHYFGAAAAVPGAAYTEFVGYFKGFAASGGGASPIWASPGALHTNVRSVRPMFIANYDNATGGMHLDYIKIEEVPLDSLGRPTELFSGDTNATLGARLGVNMLDEAGASLTDSDVMSNTHTGAGLTVLNPVGGAYTGGGAVTGAIKITLPQSWTNTMLKFVVDIYEYGARKSILVHVGGYNYEAGSNWINATARIIGEDITEWPVRFGHDGTKCCIWIGETTTVWQYPQIRVRSFQAGYSNFAKAQWATGWTVTFATSFGTITATETETLPGSNFTRSTRRWGSHLSRNSGDSTPMETIVQRVNNSGRANDSRLMRACDSYLNQVTKSSYTTVTSVDAGTTATINIAAWTAYYNYGSYSYPSGALTGKTFGTAYYVYMVDPNGDGTSVTYATTTTFTDTSSAPDRAYIGKITTVNDGGGGGVPPNECVAVDMWTSAVKQAGTVTPGDPVIALYNSGSQFGLYQCKANRVSDQECVRIETVSGCAVVCSIDTPVTLRSGSTTLAPNVATCCVAVLDRGVMRWEFVARVDYVGIRSVAHISIDDGTYAAGEVPDRYVFTHNANQKP